MLCTIGPDEITEMYESHRHDILQSISEPPLDVLVLGFCVCIVLDVLCNAEFLLAFHTSEGLHVAFGETAHGKKLLWKSSECLPYSLLGSSVLAGTYQCSVFSVNLSLDVIRLENI